MSRLPESVWLLLGRSWPHKGVTYPEQVGGFSCAPPITTPYKRSNRQRVNGFNSVEVRALVDDGVLIPLADSHDVVEIDNQENLALQFFLAEVAYAWQQYQTRTKLWRERRDNAIARQKRNVELRA